MDSRSKLLVKSKSSSYSAQNKTKTQNEREVKSNADFQTRKKKRGVYVERQAVKYTDPKEKTKHNPRPRLNKKKYISSVLTILSKSTTGTQFPESEETKPKKRKRCSKFTNRESTEKETETKTKPKYRSKVLNDLQRHLNEVSFEVIKYNKKESAFAPSNISGISSDTFQSVKRADPGKKVQGIAEQVMEGRQMNEKKSRLTSDPSTLIGNEPKEDDSKLVNLFVDLLETTFNVYSVSTEFNPLHQDSNHSSKLNMVIDENVATKMSIKDYVPKREPSFFCIPTPEPIVPSFKHKKHMEPPRFVKTRLPKLPSPVRKRKSVNSQKSKTYTSTSKKPKSKKQQKSEILKTLKEELAVGFNHYQEPQSFFEVLKVMAKNKQRNQAIYSEPAYDKKGGKFKECIFKRRNIIPAGKKYAKKKHSERPISKFDSPGSSKHYKKNTHRKDSNHSLTVYSSDVKGSPVKKLTIRRKKRPISYDYGSSLDFDY